MPPASWLACLLLHCADEEPEVCRGMLGLFLLSISLPSSLSPLVESLLYAKLSGDPWKVLNVKCHHCLIGGEATNVKAT